MEKFARRFELGKDIEERIETFLDNIVESIVRGGVPVAISKPNVTLSNEPITFSFPTDEFKRINRIPDNRLADELIIDIVSVLCFVTDPGNAFIGAGYDIEKKMIDTQIFFTTEDIRDPNSFVYKIDEMMTTSIRHEILHFIKDMGDFNIRYKDRKKEKPRRYIQPQEDATHYLYQNVELENHLSDFHDAVSGARDVMDLANKLPRSIGFIFNAHKFPEGKTKKKVLSRIYSTVQEMNDRYLGDVHEKVAMQIQRIFMAALRNDESLTNQEYQAFERLIGSMQ